MAEENVNQTQQEGQETPTAEQLLGIGGEKGTGKQSSQQAEQDQQAFTEAEGVQPQEEGAELSLEDQLKGLQEQHETLEKRRKDQDSFISQLQTENAQLRQTEQKAQSPQSPDLESLFQKENEEVAQLRMDGRNIEAAVKERELADRILAAQSVAANRRLNNILDTAGQNLPEFDKYRAGVFKNLQNVPLSEVQDRSDYWVKLMYNAEVGEDFKKAIASKRSAPKTESVEGGGGKSTVFQTSKTSKTEKQEILDGIINAGGKKTMFT